MWVCRIRASTRLEPFSRFCSRSRSRPTRPATDRPTSHHHVNPALTHHDEAETQRLLLERECPKINLQVREGNEPARRFYESLGYANDNVTSFGLRLARDN